MKICKEFTVGWALILDGVSNRILASEAFIALSMIRFREGELDVVRSQGFEQSRADCLERRIRLII